MAFMLGVRIVSYGVVGAAAILTHETTKAYKEKFYQWAWEKLRRSSPEPEVPSRPSGSDGSVHYYYCDVDEPCKTTDQQLDGDSILHVQQQQQQQQLITVDDVYQDQAVETEEEAKQSQGTVPVYHVHVVESKGGAKQSQGTPVYQDDVSMETEPKQSQLGTPVYQDDVSMETEAKQRLQGHVMETKAKRGQGTPIYQDDAFLDQTEGGAKQSGEGASDQAPGPPPLAGRGASSFQKAFDAAKLWAQGVYGQCEGKQRAAVWTVLIKRISRRIFWLACDAVFPRILQHNKALLQMYRILASELKASVIWFT